MPYLHPQKPSIFLEDSRGGPEGGGWIFEGWERVITCRALEQVEACLTAIDQALEAGFYIAGWVGYEAGLAFEPRLRQRRRAAPNADAGADTAAAPPLIWIGVFRIRRRLSVAEAETHWANIKASPADFALGPPAALDEDGYLKAIDRIQEYIKAGDVYQVNYTFPLDFTIDGSPLSFYAAARRAQRVAYGAVLTTGAETVLSFSPELFFRKTAGPSPLLEVRPMKGTLPRGPHGDDDAAKSAFLRADPKNRAENLMIVDLMRNDVSRLARTGSVEADRLFEVETYQTVLQMTSRITAELPPDTPLSAIFKCIFPCGSVTGAPKIRAMEIIDELEAAPRGVYTGAIGHAGPEGDACFSVPIRTILIDRAGRARLGVGSGIVADSAPQAEYEESLLKSRFLRRDWPAFDVFETLGWRRAEGYGFLDLHLDRLAKSAAYFGFAFDRAAALKELEAAAGLFEAPHMRVKLLLSRLGHVAVAARPYDPAPPADPLLALSPAPVDRADPFLYHKTTHRGFYERERARLEAETGCFEALFQNQRGELTEGSFSNLFVERGGLLLTPARDCGLLAGVLRESLLRAGPARCREAILYAEDLKAADAIYIGNALRGLIRVRLAP